MAGPSDPRFPLSAIRKALDAAGIPDEYQDLVFDALKKSRKKRGRKQEDDRKALRRVFFLAAEERYCQKLGLSGGSGGFLDAILERLTGDEVSEERGGAVERAPMLLG
jgi:hypothetical protein